MIAVREAAPPQAEPAAAGRPRRLHGLTGLRYLAAVAVVLVHVSGQFTGSDTLTTAADQGYLGVTFFFLLSGFVLTWSYSGQPAASRFWWGRFSRIWPLQAVLMVVAFTVLAGQVRMPGAFGKVEDLLLLQAWDPRRAVYFGGNGVSWSLSCEMFFYLLFPLAVLGVQRLRRRGLALTAVVTLTVMLAAPVIASGANPLVPGGLVSAKTYYWLFYIFPPYRFGEFLLGMLLARAVLLGIRVRRPRLAVPVAVAGLVALVVAATHFALRTGTSPARPLVSLAALPLFALLLLATTSIEVRDGRTRLASPWLVLLGEWSFALFLVHKPLFLITRGWGWWDNAGGVAGLVLFVVFLAFATGVAAAVHYLAERPIERTLRKAFDRSRASRTVASAASSPYRFSAGAPGCSAPPGPAR